MRFLCCHIENFGKLHDFDADFTGNLKVTKPKTVTKTVEILCEGCKRPVEAGGNMTAEQVAEASKTKYGKVYCSACRAKKRQAEEAKKQILEAKGQTEEEVNLPFPLD